MGTDCGGLFSCRRMCFCRVHDFVGDAQMPVKELIEQIGGRERLEAIVYAMGAEPCDADPILDSVTHGDIGKMARALLAVLEAREKPRGMPDYQVYVGHKVFEDGCFRVVDMVELSVLERQQEITRQLAAESNRMFDELRAAGLRTSAMLAAAPAPGGKK